MGFQPWSYLIPNLVLLSHASRYWAYPTSPLKIVFSRMPFVSAYLYMSSSHHISLKGYFPPLISYSSGFIWHWGLTFRPVSYSYLNIAVFLSCLLNWVITWNCILPLWTSLHHFTLCCPVIGSFIHSTSILSETSMCQALCEGLRRQNCLSKNIFQISFNTFLPCSMAPDAGTL